MTVVRRLFVALLLVATLAAGALAVRHAAAELSGIPARAASGGTALGRAAASVIRLDPTAWRLPMDAATALAAESRFDEALDLLDRVKQVRSPIDGYFLEAAIHAESGPPERAIAEFERLRRISPLDRPVVQNLVRLDTAAKRQAELAKLVAESERRWPRSFDLLVSRGNLAVAVDRDPVAAARDLLLAEGALVGVGGAAPPRPVPEVFGEEPARRQLDALLNYLGPASAMSKVAK